MVFTIIRDSVQQKYCIDVSTSFVQGSSNHMIRVKGVTEILYLVGDDSKEYENWLR
jgi:hypothetical protein